MEESDQKKSPIQIREDSVSVKSTNKRQRESSLEEETLPTKKFHNSTKEGLPISNKILSNLVTNATDNDIQKEVMQNTNLSNTQENISLSMNALQSDLHHIDVKAGENKESCLQNTCNSINEINDSDSYDMSQKSEIVETSEKSVLNENTHVNVLTSRTKGTEVVDGLELSVECASDKEESSSESDKDYCSKPRKKTIIIKAKSNESDDDTDNDIENNDNEEDEIKHTSSDNKTSTSGNESDNNNADKSKDNRKRKRDTTKPENNKRIQFLRKCLRTAGITARFYQESLRECKTNAAKIRYLKSVLEKHGVNGKPTLKKCQKVKLHNERLQEVSELDTSNIISEGRVTRSQSARDFKNTVSSESHNTYKRIKIIDSDSE